MKLEWQNAPATTWWGHDMVVATVALGKDHSVDLYCARSKTAEAEALLKKPWVGLTDDERKGLREWQKIQEELGPVWAPMMLYLYEAIEAKLKEKNT